MDTVVSIAVPSLRSLLGTPRAPLVVDVRKPPAFDADPLVIASAIRRGHDTVAHWAATLPAGREVVAYCVHGHEVSQGVARALAGRGVRARYLEGGIEGWKTAGAPTVRKLPEIGHGSAAATRWVTREHPKIDRVACPWLLRRQAPPKTAGSRKPIWPTSAAKAWRAGHSRSPPPGGTTCCSSARPDRKSTRLNSSHVTTSRMPSSA